MTPSEIAQLVIQDYKKSNKANIIAIVGPTASGKTDVSIAIAKELANAEIINADSRLIYSGMDIGTAKPRLEERAGIPHHLIDIKNPNEDYSAFDYRNDFDRVNKQDPSKQYIAVGGTGMYLQSALEDLDLPNIPPNHALREELDVLTIEELQKELLLLDSDATNIIDIQNKRRVIRAIEQLKQTAPGTKLSCLRQKTSKPRYSVKYYGLNFHDRERLYERINNRVHLMIEQGLVSEVEQLFTRYPNSKILFNTIGYGEIYRYLQKEHSLEQAIALIQKKTRNYAKRQLTWFRANSELQWFYWDEV